MRSATSTSAAANYRAACRCRSRREFVAKISLVVEECDETDFWLDLISELNLAPASELRGLVQEAGELLAVFLASRMTARGRMTPQGGRSTFPNS